MSNQFEQGENAKPDGDDHVDGEIGCSERGRIEPKALVVLGGEGYRGYDFYDSEGRRPYEGEDHDQPRAGAEARSPRTTLAALYASAMGGAGHGSVDGA